MSAPRVGRALGTGVQLAAALVVTVCLAGAIELAAHLAVPRLAHRIAGSGDYVKTSMHVLELAPGLNPTPLVADPALLWRAKPLATKTQPVNPLPLGSHATWTLITNSHGFRGPELSLAPAPPVYRIVCIGDSITFGFNVDQDATYERALARALAERYPGRRFEVVNTGVPGWTWVQGRAFLERGGLALSPAVVVMGHGTNDRFYPARITDREWLAQARATGARLRERLLELVSGTDTYRLLRLLSISPAESPPSPVCSEQIAKTGRCRRVALDEITDEVRTVQTATRTRGVDLIVVNFDFMATDAVDGVRAGLAGGDVPFRDFVAELTARREAMQAARAASLGLAPAAVTAAAGDTRRVRFRVQSAPGRLAVRADGFLTAYHGEAPLRDDGSEGDEGAGDGVYTGTLVLPAAVVALSFRYERDGEPELVPQPPLPSTQAARRRYVRGDVLGPVDEFSRLELMAEQTHPDAAGHAVIAAGVLEEIEALPSFRRFIAGPDDRAARVVRQFDSRTTPVWISSPFQGDFRG